MQTLFMALLVGTIYFRLDRSQAAIAARTGALYFCLINTAFSTFSVMQVFLEQRPLFARETAARFYTPLTYTLARAVVEVPQTLFWPLLLSSVAYGMVGFRPGVVHFAIFVAVLCTMSLVCASLMLTVGAAAPNPRAGMILASVSLVILFLFGGFFLPSSQIPKPYIPLEMISPFRWANRVLVYNEFHDAAPFHCQSLFCIPDGNAYLVSISMSDVSYSTCFSILLAEVLFFRILAYLALSTLHREKR